MTVLLNIYTIIGLFVIISEIIAKRKFTKELMKGLKK